MINPSDLPGKLPAALSQKGASPACSSCGKNSWGIVPKVVAITISEDHGFTVPPPHIPVAAMICNHCGFVRIHSLIVLDLLDKQQG